MKKSLALSTTAAFLFIASLAYAEGTTRKEYVAKVDPICKAYEMKSVHPWTNSESTNSALSDTWPGKGPRKGGI